MCVAPVHTMSAPDMYCHHMSLLPPPAHPYIDKMVDWDNNTDKDLYKIARHMLRWESLAPQLGLDHVEVDDIKKDCTTLLKNKGRK